MSALARMPDRPDSPDRSEWPPELGAALASQLAWERARKAREAEQAASEAPERWTPPAELDDGGARLARARELLCPGARFEGTIAIPGSERTGRECYRLWVVAQDGEALLCRHAGYGDEQFCELETVCTGLLDLAQGAVRGTVAQLRSSEDGFFFPSSEVTHTFDLVRCDESAAATVLCARFFEAAAARAEAWAAWGLHPAASRWLLSAAVRAVAAGGPAAGEDTRVAARVALPDVFTEAELLAERECCRLRRLAQRLDAEVFVDAAAKRQALEDLRRKGCSRAGAHEATDVASRRLQGLYQLLPFFLHSLVEAGHEHIHACVEKAELRLMMSFGRLDKALQSAQERLPRDTLESWRVAAAPPDAICAVCCAGIGDGEAVLKLPCSHVFHEACIAEWLHRSPACPSCRARHAGEEAEETESVIELQVNIPDVQGAS